MGCQTWFYNKVERSFDDAKRLALERKNYFDLPVEEMLLDDISKGKHNKRSFDFHIAARKIELEKMEAGDIILIYEHQPESPSFYDYSTGNYYVGIDHADLPFDRMPFGVSHYPEVMLASFDETVEWVEKFGKSYHFDGQDDCMDLVKKFWDKYPDGMILFG